MQKSFSKAIATIKSVPSAFWMQELEPKAALQQIALPMDADKRAAGLATLSQLVWTADSARLGMPRPDYIRAVRDQLTAAEQVCCHIKHILHHNTGLLTAGMHCSGAVCKLLLASIRHHTIPVLKKGTSGSAFKLAISE